MIDISIEAEILITKFPRTKELIVANEPYSEKTVPSKPLL
jgi:hypothetical protein